MATIGSLVIDLSANSAVFARDMAKAQRSLSSGTARMNRSLAGLDNRFNKMSRSIGGIIKRATSMRSVFGVLAGSAGIGLLVKRSLEAADQIGKTADKLGVSTDALQEYRFGAQQAGVDTKTLDLSLQRLTRRLGEAVKGKGELKDTLKEYGIAVTDAGGRSRSTEAVLGDLAEAIKGAGSDAERLRIAFKAFDSEGAALVNLLRDGRAGLDAYSLAARELGIVLEEDLIRGAEEARNKLAALGEVVSVRATSAMIRFAPEIATVAQFLTDAAKAAEFFLDKIRGLENKSLSALDGELGAINSKIADTVREIVNLSEAGGEAAESRIKVLARDLEVFEAKARKIEAAIEARNKRSTPPIPTGTGGGLPPETVKKARAKTTGVDEFGGFEQGVKRAQEAMARFNEEGQRIREMVDPLAAYNAQMEHLERLLRLGSISQGEFNKASKEASATLKKQQDEADKTGKAVQAAMEDGFGAASSAIADFVRTGELDLRRFAEIALSVLGNILKAKAAGGGAGGGGGGFFGTPGIGDFFSSIFSAKGNVFAGGKVTPFARGGVVSQPTVFPMRDGVGLMGEAGPEAVMPLKRGRGGRLGVEASGGGGGGTVINIDARGAELGVEERIRAVLRQEEPRIVGRAVQGAVAGVQERAHGGGAFSKAMGRR